MKAPSKAGPEAVFEFFGDEWERQEPSLALAVPTYPRTAAGLWQALGDICGITRVSWKQRKFFDYVFETAAKGEIVQAVVCAGRGTGKTYDMSAIELVIFHVLGWDWCNLGGSLGQAKKAYRNLARWAKHPAVASRLERLTQTLAETADGQFIQVLAASQTSVRSPHVGGENKGGGLVLDEEAEMDPELVTSALPIVNTGNPSAVIRLSTPHKQTGTFRLLVQHPEQYGYKPFSWDVFDAMKMCKLHCDECPVRAFAEDQYVIAQTGEKTLKHKAFCGGRAHFSQGHLSLDRIASDFRQVDLYTWRTEYMGEISSRLGFVYDPLLLDAGVIHDNVEIGKRFPFMDKALGIDWGYNETAIVGGFRGPKRHGFVYGCWVYNNELSTTIIPDIVAICLRDGVRAIYADAAGAFQIADLKAALNAAGLDIKVIPVPFGTAGKTQAGALINGKEWGISNVSKMLETGKLHFYKTLNGQATPNHDRMLDALKGYERDENGKPKKENDHIPDALLCLGSHFPQASKHGDPALTSAVYRDGRVVMGDELMAMAAEAAEDDD